MSKLYIPIIGTISAGKSTFLKAFLGIEVLETGATTTTKFICLIKNSQQTLFYHVIPKTQNGSIIFSKEGSEIKGIKEIKKKIEEINKTLAEKKGNKNEIFYMLEAPIKYINNAQLLDKCIFMDIPGLNENDANYIDNIFSIINLKSILFEIMIFDSTSVGDDGIIKIFKQLNEKGCLKKEDNLFILNKIDQITQGGEQDIIDTFKKYFYDNFEDEKISEPSKIEINFSKNHFIPMNSILYQAESKFNEDFYSMLLTELFYYNNLTIQTTKYSSFLEFLEERIGIIISQNSIDINKVEEESEKIDEDNMETIKNAIEKINDIKPFINPSEGFLIGIKIGKSSTKKLLKKFFVIHKLKLYTNYSYSKSYIALQEIINNITFENNDLASPPSAISSFKETKPSFDSSTLNDLDKFLRDKFNDDFKDLNMRIQVISDNLYGRRIRIPFIGNISAGKSTVLNSIIGEEILPTKDSECTYRGIIIKYKNIDNFLLFRTKLKILGENSGYTEYNYFEEDNEPYCCGIENIKSYLKNKNSDSNMNNNDAYIVIHGRLKIFDYIKIEEKLKEKIEFIDLPGHNRENNNFVKNYYDKILKYSNSCIYINEAKSIDDNDSVVRMKNQYNSDKGKLYGYLQSKFINSCLFLVNKSDTIPKKDDREKIKNNLIKNIKEVEPNISNDKINISFFSGKYFIEYLKYYRIYVEVLENKPILCLNYLYKEWSDDKWYLRNFKNYIVNKIGEKIEEKFDLELDEDNVKEIPPNFYNNLKSAFNQLYSNKHRGINSKEEDQIIKKLYCIYNEFKNKDFSDTNYSSTFFNKLKEVIIYSENLQKENFKKNIDDLFQKTDELFRKEITSEKGEKEKEKKKRLEKYELFKNNIIPKIKNLLNDKENKVKSIITETKNECLGIMDDEISNYKTRLSDCDNKIENAGKKLQDKLKPKIEDMQTRQDNETKNILKEILDLSEQIINAHYNSKGLTMSELEKEKEKDETTRMIISIISSSIAAIATLTGIVLGSSLGGLAVGAIATTIFTTLGGALIGGLGLLGGVAIGGIIMTIGYFYNKYKIQEQYKESLEKNKNELKTKFEEIENSFSNDFKAFKDALINELNIKVDLLYKEINISDPIKWEELKNIYAIKKENIQKQLNEILKKN